MYNLVIEATSNNVLSLTFKDFVLSSLPPINFNLYSPLSLKSGKYIQVDIPEI